MKLWQAEPLLAAQNTLGEGPLWYDDTLFWVDILQHRFYRWRLPGGLVEAVELDTPVALVVPRRQGGLVLGTGRGIGFWDERRGLYAVADPEKGRPGARFNDGAVDPQGRLWAGTLHEEHTPTSALYRFDPDGSVHTMIRDVCIANGLDWSPDGKTFYFTDSPRRTIYAYDFDGVTGSIANRRSLVTVPEGEGVPDGLVVDAEGFLWSARYGGGRVVRYSPEGATVGEVRLPVDNVTSCAFGGPALDVLYITTAWQELDRTARAAQPQAGDLFTAAVGVNGRPAVPFAG